MKKMLLALVLLGAMSTLASAAVIQPVITSLNGEPINATQEITIKPSDVINFDLMYTQDTAMKLLSLDVIVNVGVEGPGTLDATALTFPFNEGFNGVIGERVGKQVAVITGSFNGMGTGILIDHFLMHCDAPGDVIISVLPNTAAGGSLYVDGMTMYDGDFGTAIVHQIPEPMTMSLLALGGLGLIRRRRA